MYALMIYSLKAGLCLAVFYLFFKALLSRETFHRFNRALLLGAVALSFALPLCTVTIERELPAAPQPAASPLAATVAVLPESGEPAAAPLPWREACGALYLLGAAAMLLRTLGAVAAVRRLIRRGVHERLDDGVVLVRLAEAVTPFSFGRCIVVSERDLAESGSEIVTHERAHLRLRHTWDLLATDAAGCLQWFNPAMWLLRRELRAIHEYEADEAVLASGVDAKRYQLLLIKKAAGGRWYSVADSFNHSNLKNRITMMLREKSSRWAGARALLLLPLVGLAVGAFAETAYVVSDDEVTKEIRTIRISGSDFSAEGVVQEPLSVVDGEVSASREALRGVDAGRIASIRIAKDSEETASYAAERSERAESGVAFVALRAAGEPAPAPDTVKLAGRVVSLSFGDRAAGVTAVSGEDGPAAEDAEGSVRRIRIENADRLALPHAAIVVDGEVRDAAALEALDPGCIERIAVLEEGSAAERYGEAAAGGAIEVETKGAMRGLTTGVGTCTVTAETTPAGNPVSVYKGRFTIDPESIAAECPIFIDGRPATRADVGALAPKSVRRAELLGRAAGREQYGEAGRRGVLVIATRR